MVAVMGTSFGSVLVLMHPSDVAKAPYLAPIPFAGHLVKDLSL